MPEDVKPCEKPKEMPLLTPHRIQEVKMQIEAEKAQLRGIMSGSGPDELGMELKSNEARPSMDMDAVKRRLSRKERMLKAMDPANFKLTGIQRQMAYKRLVWLKGWLQAHMLTKQEMSFFPSNDDPVKDANYRAAVEHAVKMEVGNPQFGEFAGEFKRLARFLDPDDPGLPNIENIRPSVRDMSGRHFQSVGGNV